ncbi:gamma-glutamyl-gamma-aminobutyrate hydrolase family protein [Serratia fonticola]|uniref:gamma-glutamyl-gamma-aminobutyrate hydrolase family protein n=1 Tax=Serratia fonticola TaxID=47917 RepID=UPI0015C58E28|nr:gamma-glutamyl-gamma-aminobutyrate hydrolase family protein [Serratia fonticola]NYA45446.1 gamma-glutamyl-gamma-aminobutyrate hydrolase family protein [Serratia fonticola]
MIKKPIIGVSCCLRYIPFGDYPPTPHHTVFHKYIDYVLKQLHAVPVLIPAIPEIANGANGFISLVKMLDGVLLTGSPSNVGVRLQQGELRNIVPVGISDNERDITTFRLIHDCLNEGVPLLGICRGMQEINVAFGGGLYDELHVLEGYLDHRSDKSLPYDKRYSPRHSVKIIEGRLLDGLLRNEGLDDRCFNVNSLHGQGISQVGEGVQIEALSEDGVIEAISLSTARVLTLGVQWHIEWAEDVQLLDCCISNAFKNACEERFSTHRG